MTFRFYSVILYFTYYIPSCDLSSLGQQVPLVTKLQLRDMTSTLTKLQPFESQITEHSGMLTNENGSLLIKPATPNELAFYQRLQQDSNLENLRLFTPTFLGTLRLMGKIDETGSGAAIVDAESAEEKDESLVQLAASRRS
jgi:hypothetical protein